MHLSKPILAADRPKICSTATHAKFGVGKALVCLIISGALTGCALSLPATYAPGMSRSTFPVVVDRATVGTLYSLHSFSGFMDDIENHVDPNPTENEKEVMIIVRGLFTKQLTRDGIITDIDTSIDAPLINLYVEYEPDLGLKNRQIWIHAVVCKADGTRVFKIANRERQHGGIFGSILNSRDGLLEEASADIADQLVLEWKRK